MSVIPTTNNEIAERLNPIEKMKWQYYVENRKEVAKIGYVEEENTKETREGSGDDTLCF